MILLIIFGLNFSSDDLALKQRFISPALSPRTSARLSCWHCITSISNEQCPKCAEPLLPIKLEPSIYITQRYSPLTIYKISKHLNVVSDGMMIYRAVILAFNEYPFYQQIEALIGNIHDRVLVVFFLLFAKAIFNFFCDQRKELQIQIRSEESKTNLSIYGVVGCVIAQFVIIYMCAGDLHRLWVYPLVVVAVYVENTCSVPDAQAFGQLMAKESKGVNKSSKKKHGQLDK